MALPPLAIGDDLATWLGTTVTDEDRAEAILSAASTLVRSHSGRPWVGADGEWEATLTETQQDAARTVVLMVAARVWNNPNGYTQETKGPFSRSMAEWAALGLELTSTEKTLLGGTVTGIPGLSSIRVVAPEAAAGSYRYASEWWLDEDEDGDEE